MCVVGMIYKPPPAGLRCCLENHYLELVGSCLKSRMSIGAQHSTIEASVALQGLMLWASPVHCGLRECPSRAQAGQGMPAEPAGELVLPGGSSLGPAWHLGSVPTLCDRDSCHRTGPCGGAQCWEAVSPQGRSPAAGPRARSGEHLARPVLSPLLPPACPPASFSSLPGVFHTLPPPLPNCPGVAACPRVISPGAWVADTEAWARAVTRGRQPGSPCPVSSGLGRAHWGGLAQDHLASAPHAWGSRSRMNCTHSCISCKSTSG